MKPIVPFCMPEPQRSQCIKIVIKHANESGFAPAMLTCKFSGPDERELVRIRGAMTREMISTVSGLNRRMLARALRLDAARIRAYLNDHDQNENRTPTQ